jgi:hypothetical protein
VRRLSPPDRSGARRRLAIRFAILAALCGASALLFVPRVLVDPGLNARPFSPETWRDWRVRPERYADNPRYGMVGDLVRRVGLDGKPMGEVAALLGPGDGSPFTWELGPGRGFGESHATHLSIEVDSRGRVTAVKHP